MARYSQTEMSLHQLGHLKKTLSSLDNRVKLPDSLRGDALLHKLEGVQPNVPAGKKILELVLPRHGVRVWATYAAAFVLVVGLLYGLMHGRPDDIATGEIVLGEQVADLTPLEAGGGISPAIEGRAIIPAIDITELGTRLGELELEQGQFVLYYQPGVLLFLDADGQTLISQVDIPYLAEAPTFYTIDDLLYLHSGVNGPPDYAYTIDITDPQNPVILRSQE